jgi:hypothetical protein
MLALALLRLALPAADALPPRAVAAQDPPIRITLNGGDYSPGDRVTVRIEPRDDGYLIVFRVDGDGHVRVLFPLDPTLDQFVRGGKRYELRGRADRQTFLADDVAGSGLIYAALSPEPLALRDYVSGDHWDYQALRLNDPSDAENELSQIVTRMTDNSRFDYDVLGYRVREIAYASAYAAPYYPLSTPYYLYPSTWYDPLWDCFTCYGYGSGFHISIGFGSNWYGRNRWGSYYDPWYSGFGYNYGWPWGYPNVWYPGQTLPYTVYHVPRPRVPSTPYGLRSRPRSAPVPTGALGGGLAGTFTPRGAVGTVARPGYDGGRPGPRSVEPTRGAPPPANGTSRPNTPPPATGRPATAPAPKPGNTGTRSRPHGGGEISGQTTYAPVTIDRRAEPTAPMVLRRPTTEAPVYREPLHENPNSGVRARPEPGSSEPRGYRPTAAPAPRGEQPRVYREPPRSSNPSPMRGFPSAPPASSPRVERQPPASPPRVERQPPAPARAPAPAPAPSGGGSSHAGRSRPGGGGR